MLELIPISQDWFLKKDPKDTQSFLDLDSGHGCEGRVLPAPYLPQSGERVYFTLMVGAVGSSPWAPPTLRLCLGPPPS